MKPSEIIKPGMIGINTKGVFDLLGSFNTAQQGDTDGAHAWLALPNGKIATTGAKALVIYGEVDPDEYLKGKTCYLLETVDPLTDGQLKIMQAAHNEMMRSGPGRIYGFWKFGILKLLTLINGAVDKTGFKPKFTRPTCPICSQAVAYPCWMASVPIGKAQGKEDWTAVLPETIIKEAMNTGYIFEQGWLNKREKPCYMYRTVKDEPFQF